MHDIKKICALAHFDIPQDRMDEFQSEFELITGYVRQLDELDLDGIEPTVYGRPLANVFRDDVPYAWLSPEEALSNAPDRIGDEFKAPKIVE
ncbi:MAG: Asp-tRNA(Asn)/Glu-tRNA(Gln) amidotransferase subunit GatC [Kiritimatiellaeota bacterium]|nr:Asp-tRNA(Asn)/Glu-tRNA(Gln) amidotransferase subunit GatC [Kiritimatiellota bacterium]